MHLEERFYELDRVKLKRWLPWLALFRAFRIAIHPRAILLGCLAILLLNAGFAGLDKLPFARDVTWVSPLSPDSGKVPEWLKRESHSVTWNDAYAAPVTTVREAFSHGWFVLHAASNHVPPVILLLDPASGLAERTTAITGLLLCLLVWSVCGVGISRIGGVRFAADEPVRLRESLGYAFSKLTSSLGAVILPLLAVLTLWIGGVVLGWLGHIPVIGGVIVGVGWGLMMFAAIGMALILFGLAAGWPLMLASVAVEDADAFDAFSRIYNYVYARPWYALFLVLLMLFYGSALIVFSSTLLEAIDILTVWSVGTGPADSEFAPRAIQTWRNIGRLVLQGFVVSYFWSATTIIYFLLRQSEDATPLDAVTLRPSTPRETSDLPLVGMPAAEQREQAGQERADAESAETPSDNV